MFVRNAAAASAALLAVLATMASFVEAQAPRGRGGMAACRTDIATFCQGLEAGGGQRMRCLAENRAKLSPDCAATVDARQSQRGRGSDTGPPAAPGEAATAPPATAPGRDAGPATPPAGNARPLAPLAPKAEMTPGPQGARTARTARPMAACRTDLATLCASTANGGEKRMACLSRQQDKLSSECATALNNSRVAKKVERQACRQDVAALCADKRGPERRQCLEANRDRLSPACADTLAAKPTKRGAKNQ